MRKYLLQKYIQERSIYIKYWAMGHLFPSEHDSGFLNRDQSWGHLLLKWILSGIQTVGFRPNSTKSHGGAAFFWHMVWHQLSWTSFSIPPRWNQNEWPCGPNKTRRLQRNRSKRTNPETLRSLLLAVGAWLCVWESACFSLHVSTRQLQAWPWAQACACESMGTLCGEKKTKKLAVTLQEHGSTTSDTHTCARTHMPVTHAAKHAKLWPLWLSVQTLRSGLGW